MTGCQRRQKAGDGAWKDTGTAISHTVRGPHNGATCAFLVRAVSNIDGFRYYYGGGLTYTSIKIGDW